MRKRELLPLLFFIDDSTFRSTFPCNLVAGKILIIFELIFIVVSDAGVKWISPSVSCDASTGSEKTISILWLSPGTVIISIILNSPEGGIFTD